MFLLYKIQGVKEDKMSNKSLLKFGVAFVVLAGVLIFLGVNYVPRIFASSSPQRNTVVDVNQSYILHSHYHNSQYQRAIAPQLRLAGSDWIERHPVLVTQSSNLAGSDWIERHPNTYSAWIEHLSSQPSK
jgi:hypothetical protein